MVKDTIVIVLSTVYHETALFSSLSSALCIPNTGRNAQESAQPRYVVGDRHPSRVPVPNRVPQPCSPKKGAITMCKFYICDICGNLIEMIEDSGVVPVCCGQPMSELLPSQKDLGQEKHVPIVISCSRSEQRFLSGECKPTRELLVQVGETKHPMSDIHSIKWICISTDGGMYRKELSPDDEPAACFVLSRKEKIRSIYAYCNLHGLWVNSHPIEQKDCKKDTSESHESFGFHDKMPGH